MKYLGYSELTKRLYILPDSARKPKIDITEDVKEYFKFIKSYSEQDLLDAKKWFSSLSVHQRQAIRWILGDEIGLMSDDKYVQAFEKAKRQNF